MKTNSFSFNLPERLIAQTPAERRGESRLMVLDCASLGVSHHFVTELFRFLEEGTLLVFNNSKVRKARLLGVSEQTGAQVEFLLLNKLASAPAGFPAESGGEGRFWEALVQRSKRRRTGSRYVFSGGVTAKITGEETEPRVLAFDRPVDDAWLEKHGRIPLPPYIRRADTPEDSERYQTVYAAVTGSAAAPTAGLHFTRELLEDLEKRGMETAFVTLHVGLGTFLPVRAENIEDHKMHKECYSIGGETADRIERAKREGRKVLAVGTTAVRTLESAWDETTGTLRRGEGATSIFIYPGYAFKVVDMLFTNFHTPESTLLMLVSAFAEAKAGAFAEAKTGAFAEAKTGAFAGRDFILKSYAEAVQQNYRFFSYGDAMLIR